MRTFVATWLLRIMLGLIFIPHAIGKLEYTETFATKFHLSDQVAVLTGCAELAGVAGIIIGGLCINSAVTAKFAWPLTALGALAIWIVQIGAIAVAHWPAWLFFNGGMEYNVTILILAAAAVLLTPRTFKIDRSDSWR